jgi:hypothetical protein
MQFGLKHFSGRYGFVLYVLGAGQEEPENDFYGNDL